MKKTLRKKGLPALLGACDKEGWEGGQPDGMADNAIGILDKLLLVDTTSFRTQKAVTMAHEIKPKNSVKKDGKKWYQQTLNFNP